MRIFGWTRPSRNAVIWYRIREPLRGLGLLGHECIIGDRLSQAELSADVVVTSVHGQEEASEGWQLLSTLPNRPLMVYDIDDDVWNFNESLPQYEYWGDPDRLLRVQNDIAVADIVTTPSPFLAEHLAALNSNVKVLPNTVPADLLSIQPSYPAEFTVGYQGGDTHKHDIDMVVRDLFRVLTKYPKTHLRVYGPPSYEGPYQDRVTVTPWQDSIRQYYYSLKMSVGLAPLTNTYFNWAKSSIKVLEYNALGIPVIASDLPTYKRSVSNHFNGILVPDRGSWFDAIRFMIENPMAYAGMRVGARTMASQHTTEVNAWRWAQAYGLAPTGNETVPDPRSESGTARRNEITLPG